MKAFKLKLFFLLITFQYALLAGEQIGSFSYVSNTPPLPESQALIGAINASNNYHTGAINVDLPLYQIKGDKLSHNISLSYSSNGIKVADEASRAGLGWNLNAGGKVTRIVRGLPDEEYMTILLEKNITTPNAGGAVIPHVFGNQHNYLHLALNGYLQDFWPTDIEPWVPVGAFYNYKFNDELPDLFYYDVNGISGSFSLNRDGTVNQLPYNNVEITYDRWGDGVDELPSQEFGFYSDINVEKDRIISFTIKDKSGNEYRFSTLEIKKFVEWSPMYATGYETPGTVPNNYVSTWHLTEVEHLPNKEKITFEYDSVNVYLNYRSINHDLAINDDCDCPQPSSVSTNNNKQINQYETALYLKKINWRYGEVNFNLADRLDIKGDKHYNEITVATKGVDGTNKIIKSFNLFTSYYEADGINTVNPNHYLNYNYRRLKLDSIGIYGMRAINNQAVRGSLESPPYKFSYNFNNNFPASHLPHKDSKSRDLWGYYNGQTVNNGIPLLSSTNRTDRYKVSNINHNTGGTYSHPSVKAYAETYLLNGITYPTGGNTTFTYELHDFNFLGKKTTGGGLRLAEKKVVESNGNTINTTYNYKQTDEINTSGYANYIPSYGYVCSANSNFDNTNSAKWYRSSNRLDNPVGIEIGYSRVVEKNLGFGSTEYLFTSSKEYPDELQNIAEQEFNFCNDYLGKYDRYFKSLHTEPIEFKLNVISGSSPRIDLHTEGNIYSEFVYNEKTVSFLDGVTKTETYNYDENTYDLRSNYLYVTDANANPAKAYVTRYKYPYDFSNNANYQKLVNQNRILPIEQNQYVFEGNPSDQKSTDFTQIDGVKYEYDAFFDDTSILNEDLGPYVSEKFRYEMTWGNNPATDPNGWQSLYKIHDYEWHLGKPHKLTDKGWSDTTYLSYTVTGKLDSLKYKDFINNYDYHLNTDLLNSFTAPDGQTINYTYDEFLRLDSVKARNNKQITKFEYSYQPNFISTYKNF